MPLNQPEKDSIQKAMAAPYETGQTRVEVQVSNVQEAEAYRKALQEGVNKQQGTFGGNIPDGKFVQETDKDGKVHTFLEMSPPSKIDKTLDKMHQAAEGGLIPKF